MTTQANHSLWTRLARITVLALIVQLLVGCSQTYQAEAIDACVVDSIGREPISDALVVVNWQLVGLEGYPQAQLAVNEAVTDKKGCFRIPRWRARAADSTGVLRNVEPTVRVLRRGYVPLIADNLSFGVTKGWIPGEPMRANVDGATIKMIKFDGSLAEYATLIDAFWRDIQRPLAALHCDRKGAARVVDMFVELKQEFEEAGVPSDLPSEPQPCADQSENNDAD
jgi:hypothetical protein